MRTATISCPECKSKNTGVLDSVRTFYSEVYRKRYCKLCDTIFFTMECVVEENEGFMKEWDYFSRCKKSNN